MKRFAALVIMFAVALGARPAASAAEGRWEQADAQDREAGLRVDWYQVAGSIWRLYGTDRMLLEREGSYALFGLDGTEYTGAVFSAMGDFNAAGQAPAMGRSGKWGRVDLNGNMVVEEAYATREEAAAVVTAQFVSQWPDGSPPYALADRDGQLLTGYQYWHYRPFSQGLAAVTDGESWGFVNEAGREVVPCQYGLTEDFQADGLAVVYRYETRAYNFIDGTGREILGDAVPYAKLWRAGQGLWGRGGPGGAVEFFNSLGELVVPAGYSYVTDPKGNLRGGIFDESGAVEVFLEDRTPVQLNVPVGEDGLYEGLRRVQDPATGLWGFESASGELAVPCIYDAVGHFGHGCASVRAGGEYGLLRSPQLKDALSDWAAEEVSAAAQAGYVTGECGDYQTCSVTRGQFAALVVNYLEKATGQAISPAPADTFTDTADEAVLKAFAAGIVQGVGEGRFSPGGFLTREQLATMLWRAMAAAGWEAPDGAALAAYSDAGEVSGWAGEGVSALAELGIMEGSGGRLAPRELCSVEQAILLVYRAAERTENNAAMRKALACVTVADIPVGAPFDELPEALRTSLRQAGEAYDGWPEEPGKEIARRYIGEGIELITSTPAEETLRRALEGQERDYLLKEFGSEDWETVYTQMLGREYVDTVILTGAEYPMRSGLKVGDSAGRAAELGYTRQEGELYTAMGGLGSAEVATEDGRVSRIRVWDCLGRRVGAFFDP